jgi:transposase-like protein
LSKPTLAGSVRRYSNQALEQLTEAFGRFARPQHPEKSLVELQRLLEDIRSSSPRSTRPARVRAVNAERRLGDEQVARLLARYSDGVAAHSVGQEFGVAAATVMRLVRKHGAAVHDLGPSEDVMTQAAKLYESGLSVQKVADRLGFDKSTMLRELKAHG